MGLFARRSGRRVRHVQIACDVKSCVYHDGESACSADAIRIGPGYAASRTDTVCATYKPRTFS